MVIIQLGFVLFRVRNLSFRYLTPIFYSLCVLLFRVTVSMGVRTNSTLGIVKNADKAVRTKEVEILYLNRILLRKSMNFRSWLFHWWVIYELEDEGILRFALFYSCRLFSCVASLKFIL